MDDSKYLYLHIFWPVWCISTIIFSRIFLCMFCRILLCQAWSQTWPILLTRSNLSSGWPKFVRTLLWSLFLRRLRVEALQPWWSEWPYSWNPQTSCLSVIVAFWRSLWPFMLSLIASNPSCQRYWAASSAQYTVFISKHIGFLSFPSLLLCLFLFHLCSFSSFTSFWWKRQLCTRVWCLKFSSAFSLFQWGVSSSFRFFFALANVVCQLVVTDSLNTETYYIG